MKDEIEEEILDFNKPDFKFVPKERHGWIQHGPYLTCETCDLEHGVYIGMKKLLVGLDENGEPIFKDR